MWYSYPSRGLQKHGYEIFEISPRMNLIIITLLKKKTAVARNLQHPTLPVSKIPKGKTLRLPNIPKNAGVKLHAQLSITHGDRGQKSYQLFQNL